MNSIACGSLGPWAQITRKIPIELLVLTAVSRGQSRAATAVNVPRLVSFFCINRNEHSHHIRSPLLSASQIIRLSNIKVSTQRRQHSTDQKPPDHYETLGIDREAGPAQIKAAYYTLSKSCHPDIVGDDPEALEKFRMITEAYDCLSTRVSKRDYDRSLWEDSRRYTPSYGAGAERIRRRSSLRKTSTGPETSNRKHERGKKVDGYDHQGGHPADSWQKVADKRVDQMNAWTEDLAEELRLKGLQRRKAQYRTKQRLSELNQVHSFGVIVTTFLVSLVAYILYETLEDMYAGPVRSNGPKEEHKVRFPTNSSSPPH